MTIIKTNKEFLCSTVTHTGQKRESNGGLKMEKEIRSQSLHEKKRVDYR